MSANAAAFASSSSQGNGLATELFIPSADRSSGACAGTYVQPQQTFSNVLDNKLRVSADQLTGARDDRMALSGAVEIQQRDMLISAPAVDIDAGTTIAFNQGLRLEQPGMVMQERRAQWQTDIQELQIEQAELVLAKGGLRAQAQRLTRSAAGQLSIDNGEFTCAPADDGWSLSARQLTVAANSESVTTRGAVLRSSQYRSFICLI